MPLKNKSGVDVDFKTIAEKFKYPILVLCIGLLLLLLPESTKEGSKEMDSEELLAIVLSSTEGVGEAKVIVSDKGVVIVCRGASNAAVRLEVIKAVRGAVGEDYPVAIRMGGCDYTEGGSSIEDCVEACKMFEKAGIDLIDLSGGHCSYQPAGKEAPYFEDMAKAVKAAVDVPVLLTGGIVDGETAERLLQEKACDMVGIGRALLKDPNWAENQIYK